MTATLETPTVRRDPFTARKTNRLREQWDKMQGQEHDVDYRRAKLLHEVLIRLDRDEDQLVSFVIAVLGEYPGKRPLMFVRFALAFDVVDDHATWAAVGGRSMILLARLKKVRRNRVMRRINKTLKNTGRTTVSRTTFRNAFRESLTDEEYRAALTERQSAPANGTTRTQLKLLRGFILTLLRGNPDLRRGMPRDVKKLLGADLVD